jgi:predicted dehydrogenase
MRLDALVVGLGQIGMGYDLEDDPQHGRVATLARAFAQHHKFYLVGGVDTSAERRALFTSYYSKPAFSSFEQALEKTAPAVVAISVPTELHYQVFLDVIKAPSTKAILCEKPLSYSLAEATEMVQLAACSGIKLYTNYMRRCDSAIVEVKRRLLRSQIASPIKGVCWYSKGLLNNGSHFLNLLQFWFGDITGFEIIDQGRMRFGHDPEPVLKVLFPTGEIYFLVANDVNFSHHSVELIAVNGRLRFERGTISWQSAVPDTSNAGYVVLDSSVELIHSDTKHLQWCVVDQIANDLEGKSTSICTGQQGLATMAILDQIMQNL